MKVFPKLTDIHSINKNIRVDLKYATKDNFTRQIVYDFSQCFLLKHVAIALGEVQKELEKSQLGLKIWDGYRPIAAQWKFWKLLPDERYVSDPRKGGLHTRGTAVDATLVDENGKELPMPTAFDDFSEKAHANYAGASFEQLRNRDLLRTVMEKHGFSVAETEWWHFNFANWEQHPPLEDPSSD